MRFSRIATVISSLFFVLVLLACNGAQQEPAPTETQISTFSPSPQITDTPIPTPTQAPPLAILLAPEGSDTELEGKLSETLQELATGSGMRFEARLALSPSDVETDPVAIVVALAGEASFPDLVAAAPQTQFLGIGYNDLEAGSNLSLVKSSPSQAGELAFISGYVAATVTKDWRAGVFYESGSGEATRQAFSNGLYYFCGLCRSVYPPYPVPGYPLYYELTAGGTPAEWDAAINYFKEWQVATVYVPPPLDGDDFLMALSQAGFNLIANRQPPVGMSAHWVATISSTDVVQEIQNLWPQLASGSGGKTVEIAAGIDAANPELFSVGKQNLVRSMIADLAGGYIDTGVGD